MPDETDDITLRQAKQIGDHLMPRFELSLQQKLDPIEGRLDAIERREANRSRGYHAFTAVATWVGTLLFGSVWERLRN